MKSALLIATVLCTVCCLEIANGSDIGFKTPEMEAVAKRFMEGVAKMKVGLMSQMKQFSDPANIKNGLDSYQTLLITMLNAKPDCVTKEMLYVTPDAITQFSKCLPDPATISAQTQKGQEVIEGVLNKLREVDNTVQEVTDPVMKAQMVAVADVENVGGFALKVTDYIFKSTGPVLSCKQNVATNLRNTLLSYISEVGQCYGTVQ